jgi:hypothetical protein
MKIRLVTTTIFAAGLATWFIPFLASAAVTLQLDNPSATTTPGSSIILTGKISNLDPANPVFLNSVSNTVTAPINQILSNQSNNGMFNQPASLNFLPHSLGVGQNYTGPIISATVPANFPAGDFWGAYNLMGGISATSTDTLAAQIFYIHVASGMPATTTPATTTPISNATSTNNNNFSNFVGLQMPTGQGLLFGGSSNNGGINPGTGLQIPINQYANGPRLITLSGGDGTLYWVNANNFKIIVPKSSKVTGSYGIKDGDAAAVAQDELNFYQDTAYVRLQGNARIYKLFGNAKRFIPSSVWSAAAIDAAELVDVNKTEFNYYKTGPAVTSADELQSVQ